MWDSLPQGQKPAKAGTSHLSAQSAPQPPRSQNKFAQKYEQRREEVSIRRDHFFAGMQTRRRPSLLNRLPWIPLLFPIPASQVTAGMSTSITHFLLWRLTSMENLSLATLATRFALAVRLASRCQSRFNVTYSS